MALRSLRPGLATWRRVGTCARCGGSARAASSGGGRVMRVWQAATYGGHECLTLSESCPVPVLRTPDDVLVRVHAASLNPVDAKLLEGYGASTLNKLRKTQGIQNALPMIPGRDFSGEVVSVGRGVKAGRLQPGDEVWGAVLPIRPAGCLAEYVLIPSVGVTKKPSGVSHVEAASLPYVALTTWSALCSTTGLSATNTRGKRVLVLGGSGGIGTFAIQLVKAWGGEVTTTCSANAMELVSDLGADIVLDYKDPDVDGALKQLKGFDVILDTTGDRPERYCPLLSGRGGSGYVTIVSPVLRNADRHGPVFGLLRSAAGLIPRTVQGRLSGQNYHWAIVQNSQKCLQTVTDLVSSQTIKPVIDRIFGFDKVPAAFRKLVKGPNRGKTVIDMSTLTKPT